MAATARALCDRSIPTTMLDMGSSSVRLPRYCVSAAPSSMGRDMHSRWGGYRPAGSGLDQAAPDRVPRELHAAAHAALLQHVGAVAIYRLSADHRDSAISLLVTPSAISLTISCSRGVSGSSGPASPRRARSRKSRTRAVTAACRDAAQPPSRAHRVDITHETGQPPQRAEPPPQQA
jgi:hypothetical protein